MNTRLVWPVLAVCCGLARHASADASENAPEPSENTEAARAKKAPATTDASKDPAAVRDDFGHALQLGFRAGLVGGYNMVFRYDQSPLCAAYQGNKLPKDQQKVCGHGAPLALDLALSFALLDFVEPYTFVRLGLTGESETDTQPLKIVGAGARIYTMSDSRFKIFIEPALGFEFEHGRGTGSYQFNSPKYEKDLVVHLAAGPQFDFAKYVGVFVDGGLTTGVLRSIHTELELQAGVQARFP